ncbi:MAG: DUF711 family protein [Desulfurococcaceae archaeon TW002]
MIIRALTLTYDEVRNLNELRRDLELSEKALMDAGFTPWTVRATLPDGASQEVIKWLCGSKYLFSAYHSSVNEVNRESLRKILKCSNAFATLLVSSSEEIPRASELLVDMVNELGIDVSTRLGFTIGDYVETPYYPLSTPKRYGASVALRYVNDFLRSLKTQETLSKAYDEVSESLKKLDKTLDSLFKNIGIPYLGIDISLSPWMNESVVPIIEYLSGTSFPSTGSAWGIKKLNNLLQELSKEIKSIGFNEVMLPVGEDNNLMKLVREGSLRLPHLTFLTAYCLVGVDMVALPGGKETIEYVLKDVLAAYEVKKKPIGVRVIPSFNNKEVHIIRFGTIPVILT